MFPQPPTATSSTRLLAGYVNFSFRLGGRGTLASASMEADGGDLQAVADAEPFGARRGRQGRVGAAVQGRREHADAGQRRSEDALREDLRHLPPGNDAAWGTTSVSGSVVAAAGGIFFGNRITDAFAIVDAGGPDVKVTRENRPVTRTGAGGKALVEGLRSYQNNRVGIDPSNLPLDVNVEKTKATVVPASRSGVMVRFADIGASASALVTFLDADGHPLPMGTGGTLNGSQAATVFVGYDGQAYVSGLTTRNVAELSLPHGGTCRAEFYYKSRKGQQVFIDKVPCLSTTSGARS